MQITDCFISLKGNDLDPVTVVPYDILFLKITNHNLFCHSLQEVCIYSRTRGSFSFIEQGKLLLFLLNISVFQMLKTMFQLLYDASKLDIQYMNTTKQFRLITLQARWKMCIIFILALNCPYKTLVIFNYCNTIVFMVASSCITRSEHKIQP